MNKKCENKKKLNIFVYIYYIYVSKKNLNFLTQKCRPSTRA